MTDINLFTDLDITTSVDTYEDKVVVYSTLWEKVVLLLYIICAWTFISTAHTIIIVTVCKQHNVQNPHNFIIAAYSMMDFNICFVPNIFFFISIALVDKVPDILCRIFGPIAIICFFTMCLLVGIMAYERYRYFVHPLTYSHDFSHRKTFGIIALIFGIASSYTIGTEIWIGRVYHSSIMYCHLPGTVYLNYIQIGCFMVPSIILSVFSMAKIWKLRRSHQVGPMEDNANASRIPKVKTALKVLMLVSGLFWGSYIPAFALRTFLFSSGYTWNDMDTRKILWPAIGIRLSNLCLSHLSSIANPFVYYMINRDLRIAIRKTLGLKQKAKDIEPHVSNA